MKWVKYIEASMSCSEDTTDLHRRAMMQVSERALRRDGRCNDAGQRQTSPLSGVGAMTHTSRWRWSARIAAVILLSQAMTLDAQNDRFRFHRKSMVEDQIVSRGVDNPDVVRAMGEVPRHAFVPQHLQEQAYVDGPLLIGSGQTISQPYIVALMTELLELDGDEKILEIGTGSGYQAAVLARLAREVYTIEIREELGQQAQERLAELGYENIFMRIGDGYQGWPEEAPFDGIMVTAAPGTVPQPLIDQLKEGGKLVIPVGDYFQDLLVLTKTASGVERREIIPVRFVPMIGEVEDQ